jgi:hypothetical protein
VTAWKIGTWFYWWFYCLLLPSWYGLFIDKGNYDGNFNLRIG